MKRRIIKKPDAKTFISLGLLFILTGCTSPPTPGMEWSCRNLDVEISCQSGNCTVSPQGEFTPMDLTLNENGTLSLCAYSGCWTGVAQTVSTAGNYLSVIGTDLPWSTESGSATDVSATLNMDTLVATVLTPDYAHPMSCSQL